MVCQNRAAYIRGKYDNEPLSPRTYLSEAEPFLEQYAQRDEKGDLQPERGAALSSPTTSLNVVSKTEGLIVFFPGTFQILSFMFHKHSSS